MPSEDLYREILENLHDGVYFVDTKRQITFWNKGAERISGYTAAEVVGSSCADGILIHMDCRGAGRFNDDHGHEVGDRVLKIAADTLSHSVRPFDTVCRWGGEEFAGVFPHAAPPMLRRIAERLRVLVARSRVAAGIGALTVTVSVGGAVARPADSIETLVKRADELMYASKNGGRNRVTVESRE